jgi:hypothetical protein
MTRVRVLIAGIEEADDGVAEFWCGPDLLATTIIHENQLQLCIAPRADGQPWLVETTSLADSLSEAMRQLTDYGRNPPARDPGAT